MDVAPSNVRWTIPVFDVVPQSLSKAFGIHGRHHNSRVRCMLAIKFHVVVAVTSNENVLRHSQSKQ